MALNNQRSQNLPLAPELWTVGEGWGFGLPLDPVGLSDLTTTSLWNTCVRHEHMNFERESDRKQMFQKIKNKSKSPWNLTNSYTFCGFIFLKQAVLEIILTLLKIGLS